MALCGGCGADTTRVRTNFNPQGDVTTEECDKCKPHTFDPQWLHAKPAMGWEAYPTKYKRKANPDGGWMYEATEEMQADTLERLQAADRREEKKYEEAVEKKRRNRRTTPMSKAEVEQVLNKWRPAMRAKAENEKKEKERARDAWLI